MPGQPHHAVQTLHERAASVMSHAKSPTSGGFWRRWLDKPGDREFADEVRAFVVALDYLLNVPPTMLSRRDLAEIGNRVEEVVRRIETEIEAWPEAAPSLAPAVYVIRTRYEELYKRGATKED
jgi:hypothetical protein